ncbi:MAG TPA: amidase [Baekduia sp.]|uniref:amidase n=1 Tax=Baekduia sp. TaxID=2600305 RepID=UPI002D770232|nr:amidase [Baekduia sp.]HET6506449.1 amidase [Baekduia sp.]
MSSELYAISATEALERFRDRSLSPVELLDAVIARAEEVEPTVNALVHERHDEARVEARAAEQRYVAWAERGGPEPRALEGLPLAIKEEEAVAGQPWTQGSLTYKDLVAEHSSNFAQRMLDAGAIVHARTTAPEYSCAFFTHSRIHGVTRNPWNPAFGVGGSSGGAGAALASGTTTLASGSDIGGSIRAPASFNGVVGFKPPYGRVPQEAPFNLDTYCHVGPLARTVADTALYENAIAGPAPDDIASLRPKYVLPSDFEPVEGLRVAVSTDLGSWPVDPEIRANTLAVAEALRGAGALVEEVDLVVDREKVRRATAIHFHLGFGEWIGAEAAAHADTVTAYAAEFARRIAGYAAGGTLLEKHTLEAELYAPVGALLDRYDALICPTMATRGLVAGDDYIDTVLTVDGVDLEFYFDAGLTPVFNIMSRCPVLNVPSGFADNGVPTGVQIAARTYDDLTTFRVGAAIEAARPWPLIAPARASTGEVAA